MMPIPTKKRIGLVNNASTHMCRLVYVEGDGLPGLIIDIYNDIAVQQMHSVNIYHPESEF